jgi:hypothetical protein
MYWEQIGHLYSSGEGVASQTGQGAKRLPVCSRSKVKLSPEQAMEAHRAVRLRGSHIVYTVGSQMAVW